MTLRHVEAFVSLVSSCTLISHCHNGAVGTRCHFVCCLRVGVCFAWLCYAADQMHEDDGILWRCHRWVSVLYHCSALSLGLCPQKQYSVNKFINLCNICWTAKLHFSRSVVTSVRATLCQIILETPLLSPREFKHRLCQKCNMKQWVTHVCVCL